MKNISKICRNILFIITCLTIVGCGKNSGNISENLDKNSQIDAVEVDGYKQISGADAKKIMDKDGTYIILDVREQDEYDEGHIHGAVLIPYTEIEDSAEDILKDKEQLILVYCRSGRRSKIASKSLVELGYKNVYEFGGIIDWEYDIE